MEQSKQVQQSPPFNAEVKLAVLERRLNTLRGDLTALDQRTSKNIEEIKDLITKIQNRPNSVQRFLEKNWKSIILVLFALMGANATVIESLSRILTGTQ